MPTGENKAKQQRPTGAEKASKTRRIGAEKSRLLKCFADVPEEMLAVISGLIEEAAYMRVTLEDWKRDLDATGWVEMFQQSEKVAPFEKKRAKAEMYLNMNPNYQKIMAKLATFLPSGAELKGGDEDGFEEFVNSR